jgi:glycine/D-amino acid oxidase-like deaminating enzyme
MTTTMHPVQKPSLWDFGMEALSPERPRLTDDLTCDVLIVGAGFTGLWSAYYLTEHAPHLKIAVVDRERVGFGASGRNGGWLSHLIPGSRHVLEKESGLQAVIDLQRLMVDSVDEVLNVARTHNMDIDANKTGNVVLATNEAGLARLQARRAADIRAGLKESEMRMLSVQEVGNHVNATHIAGGLYVEPVARIHPGKLVRNLALLVESRGVKIYEDTAVETIDGRTATTPGGRISAENVLVCTEGFSGPLLGRRRIIPIKSSMIATKQLSPEQWDAIGWGSSETLSDTAHSYMYAQRTADGRIALGGRGKPYYFGSRVNPTGDCHPMIVEALLARLERYFPGTGIEAEYGWSGVLGVSRDWCAAISHDRDTGLGTSTGYAGHGVGSSNLGARTLVDLVLQRDTEFARSALVNRRSPSWEPEPIRWTGIQSMYRLFRTADAWEERTHARKTSLVARFAKALTGMD